jgi:hypothetical protein
MQEAARRPHTPIIIPTLAIWESTLLAAGQLRAQAPSPPNTTRAIDATVGNQVLQLRYLTDTPLKGVRINLDYGVLLSDSRKFIGSTAWMFDTDLNVLPRLTFQVGPQGYLARLSLDRGRTKGSKSVCLGFSSRASRLVIAYARCAVMAIR